MLNLYIIICSYSMLCNLVIYFTIYCGLYLQPIRHMLAAKSLPGGWVLFSVIIEVGFSLMRANGLPINILLNITVS